VKQSPKGEATDLLHLFLLLLFLLLFSAQKSHVKPPTHILPENPEPASQNPRLSSLSERSTEQEINPKTVACLPPPTRYTVVGAFHAKSSLQSCGSAISPFTGKYLAVTLWNNFFYGEDHLQVANSG
jgi:hypothetical protein